MLRPLFQGAFTPLGEALVCTTSPPDAAIPVAKLLHEAALVDDCLHRHARHLGVAGADLRATASSWCFAYLDVLLPPMVAAASVLQHVFPAQPEAMAVRLGSGAVPQAFHIGHEGHARPGTETAVRFGPLIDAHLAPLFAALTRQARVAPKILWGNLARRLDGIFDQALELTRHAPSIAHDRDHLLHTPLWHDGRPNPMHRLQRRVTCGQSGTPLTLHRQCCLFHLLPGQGYCGACPLAPQFQPARRTLSAAAPSS